MLILDRQVGQSFIIRLQPNLDPATPVGELFSAEPIGVRVTRIKGDRVRLGVSAHGALCIVREELAPQPLAPDARVALAMKLRVLMYLRKHTVQSLAQAAGLPVERVMFAEGGAGVEDFTDLEKLARALRVKTVELFRPPGRTLEERAVLAELEGTSCGEPKDGSGVQHDHGV